ncbi:hypothetical protein NKF06_08625 [Haloferax sp. AB510]|uniref:hypothetical protein n=1 Tax=Haloferax sp. AB510 TaxID=2934172 RepID=UPI00209C6B2F|nr:hypothetical protein [Haloferax sp. AB510]MCO8266648.1 hypothetical protein [Haloferax sp. AB510]
MLTVVVSFIVASAPILYPDYSLFTRRARDGVDRLAHIRERHDDVKLGYLDRDDDEFKEVVEVIELIFSYDGEPERICMAVGPVSSLGEFTGFGMQYGISENGVLYVVEKSGDQELLQWQPWSPSSTLQMQRLSRGVKQRAQERSHTITVVSAVLWATISIIIVI